MANRELPRRGCAPHLALSALHKIGGEATVQSIIIARQWKRAVSVFRAEQIEPLVRSGLISIDGDWCKINRAGLNYLGIEVKDEPQGEVVGPRYNHGIQPLNLARHFPPRPLRAGADSYRAIPSVMGDQRIQYR